MSVGDFYPGAALEQLAKQQENISQTRLAAAKLCLFLAQQSGEQALLDDVLNQFELTATGDPLSERRSSSHRYGFWLSEAQEIRFPDGIYPPPRAAAITVQTGDFFRGDDDGVTLSLNTEPGRAAMRLQLQVFHDKPQWWIDIGETQEDIGARFEPTGEESMKQYLAAGDRSTAALDVARQAIVGALSTATWEETVNYRGDLI